MNGTNHFLLAALILLTVTASCARKPAEKPRFQAPPGFSVELAANNARIGSLVTFTFDSLGRPVVAKERKHPIILIDADNDGIHETEKVFSTRVNTLQGLWFDGRTLYAVGNNEEGQCGLYKLEDTNGDDQADTFEQISIFNQSMGEHGPHDIRRGPDGIPTIMLGNHTGVPEDRIDPASPLRGLKEWQLLDRYMDARGHAAGILAPGGVVVRFNEDKRNYTILFGGFRNAYNHAYNYDGEAFTFDSDMEWDINLPWYREVRTVHGVPGADYGWRTGSGKFPAYFLDTLPPAGEHGRGSPVGVEFYQHSVYPRSYFDVFLEADWSRGRILATTLVRDGATWRQAQPNPPEFIHGEPLNVTDLETGPDGFVYFTTGGRDTEGGFYRIRYTPGFWERVFPPARPTGILAVVRQPQPLSSWGHAALLKTRYTMAGRWGEELEQLARDGGAESRDRVQALLLLQRFGPKPNAALLRPLSQDRDPKVRAGAIYVVGLHSSPRAKAIAASGLRDRDALVRRRAAEALVRMGLSEDQAPFAPVSDVYGLLGDADRFVRYAGRVALERMPRSEWRDRVLSETRPLAALEGYLALLRTDPEEADLEAIFERLLSWLKRGDLAAMDRLRALRVFSIAASEGKDVRATLKKQVSDLLLPQFPDKDERVSRELARVIAYCGQPEAIGRILDAMPRDDERQPLQIHYVYSLRSIPHGWTEDRKQKLSRWFQKASKWRGGASFPGFINLMFDDAMKFFTEEEKKLALRRVPEFAPPETVSARAREREGTGWRETGVLSRSRGVQAISAQEILEYQMFDPMTLKAKASEGAKVYEKECASCHRFGDLGQDFGPDLTTLRSRFKKSDILEAILWPSKTISDQYESTIVETRDGDILNALVVREDQGKLVLKTGEAPRPIEVLKSAVRSRRKSSTSIMPEGLLDGYGQGQIADLLAFLQRGPGSKGE